MDKLVELIAKEDYISAKPILETIAGKKLVELIDRKKSEYVSGKRGNITEKVSGKVSGNGG
jgi:hypothetical protein